MRNVIFIILSFVLGAALAFLLVYWANRRYLRRKKKQSFIEKIGVMNFILILVGVALLVFTVTMILIFRQYGQIPDTLVTCVFAALGGECGVMGWIKTNKDRQRDREWELEDREELKQNEESTERGMKG